MNRIGLLGGTFDPFHLGHLEAARALPDRLGLDELLVIPSARPPHRPPPVAGPEDRLDLARAGCRDLPNVHVLGLELERPGPSYTIDTVAEVLAGGSPEVPGVAGQREVVLLLGADAAAEALTWHRWEELRRLVRLAVFQRRGRTAPEPATWAAIHPDWPLLELQLPEVSATELRRRLGRGEGGELLPEPVARLIAERGLYVGAP
ncbi:MAG: nicotinate (nicotinamide) nucleotide adenylyltransferase [Candidatus Dormibacteria bacterium]